VERTLDGHALGAASTVGELRTLLDLAVVKTRSLARPSEAAVLGEGLLALQDLAADTERRFNVCCGSRSVGVELQPIDDAPVPIAQDATNNAIRHAMPRGSISPAPAGPGLTLAVWDVSAGFDPRDVVDHHGLRLMRYRAELLGGSLEVSSVPGGTTVLCSVGLQ
jgi:signal transduction histidine kinase